MQKGTAFIGETKVEGDEKRNPCDAAATAAAAAAAVNDSWSPRDETTNLQPLSNCDLCGTELSGGSTDCHVQCQLVNDSCAIFYR